jgi:hypothetical protein
VKVDVIYEKADILELVKRDLRDQRVPIKEDSPVAYKGALQIRLTIDLGEQMPPDATSPRAVETAAEVRPARTVPSADGDGAVDMNDVLAESRHLEATSVPRFELANRPARPLAPNESYEYPKE